MTNRQLLQTPKELLSELDKQRLFLLQVEGTPAPCPACKVKVNALDAAGIDIDAYDFGKTQHSYRCPDCSADLEQIVPMIAGGGSLWYWQLKHSWLQEELRKAKAFDEQSKSNESSGPA
jgi:hypothetical protein